MCACLCGLLLLPAIYLHLSIHDVHGGFHVCDCVSMLSLHRCIKPRMYVQMYVVLLVCVGVSVCVCMQLFFSCKYVPQLFRPSHPSRRPIFSLSRSQTTTPLFTADVSLVPCPISHNPLPRFQEPMFAYCPPHLFYIANSPQHPPLSPFIFGQLSLFTPRHVYLWFAPLPPLLAFSPYIQPHYFSQSTSKIPPENLALPSHFYISCELHHIINLSYSQFFNLHLSSSLPLMG